MSQRITIHRHADLLRAHGLDTVEAIRDLNASPFKVYPGRRDVIRLKLDGGNSDAARPPVVLFIKRNWVPYRKHAIVSLLRHGRVLGFGEREGNNLLRLDQHGISVSRCVATGAIVSGVDEQFSFLITEAAPGEALDDWLAHEPDELRRRAVSDALAAELRRVHDAGFALPTLLARHVFVTVPDDLNAAAPTMTFIDIDRLDRPLFMFWRRAKDLAHLHLSVPFRRASMYERLRLLQTYSASRARRLLPLIRSRAGYLLQRRPERSEPFLRGLREDAIQRLLDEANGYAVWSRWRRVTLTVAGVAFVATAVYFTDMLLDTAWFEREVESQTDDWVAHFFAFQRDFGGSLSFALISAVILLIALAIYAHKFRHR